MASSIAVSCAPSPAILGLDEEALVAEYVLATADRNPTPEWAKPQPSPPPEPAGWPRWIGAALALLLLVGGTLRWRVYAARRAERRASAIAAELAAQPAKEDLGAAPGRPAAPEISDLNNFTPQPADPAPSPAAKDSDSDALQLTVEAGKGTSITVSADGAKVFTGKMIPGQSRQFAAQIDFEVHAQDAGAVLLELNGQTLAPMGKPGRSGMVVLTRDDLKSGGRHIGSELYDEVLSGRATRERKLAVCSGSATLVSAERAELLAVLAEDPDEMIRERAANTVQTQPLDSFLNALKGDSPTPQLFRHCGRNLIEDPKIATALFKHWRCPPQFLPAAARRLPTSTVQEMMQDLERLSTQPALASALLQSASLTGEQRVQLEELLREDLNDEAAFKDAAEAESDPTKRQTLIQRLSKMRIVERVTLAFKGNKEERMSLIRDPCKVVQRSVLQSPRVSEREIEGFAGMTNVSEEVLRGIALMRKYARNYTITRNLIFNPKTPVDISLHLLPQVNPADLKALAASKNIPDVLRSASLRLQHQRDVSRKGGDL